MIASITIALYHDRDRCTRLFSEVEVVFVGSVEAFLTLGFDDQVPSVEESVRDLDRTFAGSEHFHDFAYIGFREGLDRCEKFFDLYVGHDGLRFKLQ